MKTIRFIIPLFLLNLIFSGLVLANPKEIIIVRHGDKLIQPQTGPVLSAKGQVRAVKLAYYFLKKFGEPDYIIATNPATNEGKTAVLRELQTVAPLANMLAARHPNTGYPLLHSFTTFQYAELAKDLLSNSQYDGKTVLICWEHHLISKLTAALGVTEPIPVWQENDFDTVYVLKFNPNKVGFTVLNNQYPVSFNGSWATLMK